MEKEIKEIPFGAKDSELREFEYTIPEGYEARIKDGKVIVMKKESEDERIRKMLIEQMERWKKCAEDNNVEQDVKDASAAIAYLEKQKEQKPFTPKYRVGEVMRTKQEAAEGITDGLPVIVSIDDNYYCCTNEKIPISKQEEYEFPPMNMKQQHAKQLGGTFTSYDMAKTFTEGQNYVIAHPEKFGLCKPAEWSDSVAKEMFIKALERAVEQTKKGYELTDCDKNSWWEDFKAYSGIKPSEKQIKELLNALIPGKDFDCDILAELYKQLKKL